MKDEVFKYLNSFQIDLNHFIEKGNKDIIVASDLISKAFKKIRNF